MRVLITLVLILAIAVPALAQSPQFELKGSVSWALSEGISFKGRDVDLPDGSTVFLNRLDLRDGITFGAGLGYYVNRNMELAFLWDYQESEISAEGEREIPIADLGVDNYHGVFIYNYGSPLDTVRPILYGGLGATYFRSFDYMNLDGRRVSSGGEGKFSTTWGAGVKIFPTDRFGFQLDFKWTPTWIKSDPGGYWCDPYWGCYTTSDPDYVNQWKFGGTLLARF